MKILIVLAHPSPESFNRAIAETCRAKLIVNGHSVRLHDLYSENFNPIIFSDEIPKDAEFNETIKSHCQDLVDSDGIIIVHPNWWGQPPAIMKGWIDKVLRPGIAYKFKDGDEGEGIPVGLLKAKTGIVFNTSNTSATRENNLFKDPLETIWKNCIFTFCGVHQFDRRMFRIVLESDLKMRQLWLKEVEAMMDQYFPERKD